MQSKPRETNAWKEGEGSGVEWSGWGRGSGLRNRWAIACPQTTETGPIYNLYAMLALFIELQIGQNSY